jgi:AAA family ATP:ADP antiporter
MQNLRTLFNIRPGEERLVGLLFTYSFLIGAARIFTRSAAMGLFLTEFGADVLPYAFIGMAVTIVLLSVAYLRLGQWLTLSRLLLVTLIFLLASSVGVALALNATRAGWLLFGLPIWYEVMWTLTSLAFWNLAGRVINVRQGKRLFGVVSSGESVALLLGGLLVPLLVGLIHTEGLFPAAAGLLLATIAVFMVINRTYNTQLNLPLEQTAADAPQATAGALKNKYVVLLCHLFGLSITSYFVVDVIFFGQATIRFPDEAALTGFVGVFFGVAGLMGLLSRLVGTGWLIRRFGIRTSILLEPVIVGTGLLLVAIFLNLPAMLVLVFWLMVVTKLFNQVLITSTTPITFNIFYQPLPPLRRTQVQTLVEGIVYPLAIGVAGGGVALLTGVLNFGPAQLVGVALVLMLLWIISGIWTVRVYPLALRQALTKRNISGEGLRLDDEASRAVLVQALQNPRPAIALHALAMLKDSDSVTLTANLAGLLQHPAPEVRQAALQVIREENLTGQIPAIVARRLAEPDAAVRAAALETLAALGQIEAVEQIYAAMDDPDRLVQSEAIVALLRHAGSEVAMMAEGKLINLALSDTSADRIMAARIVGRVTRRNLGQLLGQLLDDPDIAVRRAALQAARAGHQPQLWARIIATLRETGLRNAAAATLVAGGKQALREIIIAFELPPQYPDIRPQLVRICGRIGSPSAVTFLQTHLDHPDAAVRSQILAALHRCRYRPDTAGIETLHTQFKVEADIAAKILARMVDFRREVSDPLNSGAMSLLQTTFDRQLAQTRQRMFWLLAFLYPDDKILQLRDNLALPAADKRAYALEMLDLTLAPDTKRLLFPLIEEMPLSQRLEKLSPVPTAQPVEQHLHELIHAPAGQASAWQRACAIHAARQINRVTPPIVSQIRVLAQSAGGGALIKEATNIVLNGETPVLATIEKVLILKTVNLFDGTPDEILAEVAALLAEVELLEGQTIFQKGDTGDCMYIIVSGQVKAHDDDTTFNTLVDGDVFGEMALLDPEPRLASITALEDTRLLRLDRAPFFELMEDHIEVVHGVIHVLSGHLRNRVRDVADLKTQLDQLKEQLDLSGTPYPDQPDLETTGLTQ